MTLGNMRHLGVQRLMISCLNPKCLHGAVLDVSAWPAKTAVPSFIPAWSVATAAVSASTCVRTGKSSRGQAQATLEAEPLATSPFPLCYFLGMTIFRDLILSVCIAIGFVVAVDSLMWLWDLGANGNLLAPWLSAAR